MTPTSGGWARLHPLSPVIRFGRALVVLLIAVAGGALRRHGQPPYVELGLVGAAVLGGTVTWLVTRWRIAGPELQIETGLLRRQSVRVNVARIQSVDIARPALARAFGLSEVRVDVAGHGRNRTRLAYLSDEQAAGVRARLLALAHGVAGDAPAPSAVRLFTVRGDRLVASALLGIPAVLLLVVIVVLAVLASVNVQAAVATFGSLLAVLISLFTVTARRFTTEFGFRVDEAPDGLRIAGGLLQTRAETVPFARIQAVRLVQPLLWQPFGWVRLELDVARQAGNRRAVNSRTANRALLPVGLPAEAANLLRRVLPGASVEPPPGARPPRRALVKAPLSYRRLTAWRDGTFAYAGSGRLRRVVTVVPLHKAQSVRHTQGPLQRALGLASVHVDAVGRGWNAVAHCREAAEARTTFTDLCELTRAGRGRISDRAVPRPVDGTAPVA